MLHGVHMGRLRRKVVTLTDLRCVSVLGDVLVCMCVYVPFLCALFLCASGNISVGRQCV